MDILCKKNRSSGICPSAIFSTTAYSMKLKQGLCGGKQASVYLSSAMTLFNSSASHLTDSWNVHASAN